MLRHVQQYAFFDEEKLGGAVRFVNLSAEAMDHDLGSIMKRMLAEVEEVHPAIVVVDSFRTVAHASSSEARAPGVRAETRASPDRLASDDVPRRRVRGRRIAHQPDLHHRRRHPLAHPDRRAQRERAPDAGDQDARVRHDARASHVRDLVGRRPHLPADPASHGAAPHAPRRRARVDGHRGAGRDDVRRHSGGRVGALRGAVGLGQVALRAALHRGGSRRRESPGIIVVFEEHPGEYLAQASTFGPQLAPFIERGLVEVLYLRSLDLTVDEALAAVRVAVERKKARRVAIDSLSAFELALAPSYRDDFRESLFRTTSALTGLGVTVLMTVDIVQSFTEFGLSPHITEFLADVLVLQRYVELEGKLEKVLAVVKMRTSRHDTSIRRYAIESSGVVVGEPVHGYGGVLTGLPLVRAESPRAARRKRASAAPQKARSGRWCAARIAPTLASDLTRQFLMGLRALRWSADTKD